MDSGSVYNGILGRLDLKQLKDVTHIHHLCLKFKTPKGLATVKEDQATTRECYFNTLRKAAPRASLINTTLIIEETCLKTLL